MTARKVFISFRFKDGNKLKNDLVEKFEELDYTINKSEDKDRSSMSQATIRKYLYEKLADTSLTIVLLTPMAVNHKRDGFGNLTDWMYDEIRYSLESRDGNGTNGLIMLYSSDAKSHVILKETDDVTTVDSFDNLARKNMMNVKEAYKVQEKTGLYDSLEDSYASLVSYEKFMKSPETYIENAISKRDRKEEFNLFKRMD